MVLLIMAICTVLFCLKSFTQSKIKRAQEARQPIFLLNVQNNEIFEMFKMFKNNS